MVIINLQRIGSDGISNVTVRGVEEAALQLRPQVRIIAGRMFKWGAREIIAGAGITNRFLGAQIGQQIKFGGDLWTVVGIFDSHGSGFGSEAWAISIGSPMPSDVRPSLRLRFDSRARMISLNS